MAIVERHFRCENLDPVGGAEHLNPVWLERLEALVAGGKTEAEAEAQLVTEGVAKTVKPVLLMATFRAKNNQSEVIRLIVKEGAAEVGKLYAVTFT